MFLLSATFYPLSVYPVPIQWFIQALPLWQAVDMLRQLTTGFFEPSMVIHLVYYGVLIGLGLLFTTKRLRALFLD
jgi:lipooligosaccharide transport system permease protein